MRQQIGTRMLRRLTWLGVPGRVPWQLSSASQQAVSTALLAATIACTSHPSWAAAQDARAAITALKAAKCEDAVIIIATSGSASSPSIRR